VVLNDFVICTPYLGEMIQFDEYVICVFFFTEWVETTNSLGMDIICRS